MEQAKTIKESALSVVRFMTPQDANVAGNIYGGTILRHMDEVAAIVAFRHARKNVVTASIDRMNFYAPVYVGNLLILKASVNYVGRTSMEVGVRIEAEDLITGKRVHTGSSYLTFVALDENGVPTEVPGLIPETEEEKRRFREGHERREKRLAEFKRGQH